MALGGCVTREELARVVAKKAGLTYNQAEGLISAFGDAITESLEKGDKVIYSNFGAFYTVHYPSKVILHPKLGAAKKMVMLPTNVVKWMPSNNIKDLVNKKIVVDSPTQHGAKRKQDKINAPAEEVDLVPVADPSKDPNSLKPGEEAEIPITLNLGKEAPSSPPEEIPIAKESKPETPPSKDQINIYEELMHDGSKEETTFKDAIRIPKDRSKPFWGRFFAANQGTGKATADNLQTNLHELDLGQEQSKEPPAINTSSRLKDGVFAAAKPLSNEITQSQPNPISADKAGQPSSQPVSLDKEIPETPFSMPKIADEKAPENKEDNNNNPDQNSLPPFPLTNHGIDYIDLSSMTVPKEILQIIPEKIARRYKVVPVEMEGKELVVAMVDPEDIEAKEIIKQLTSRQLSTRLASEEDINHILDQYQGLESEVEEAIEEVGYEESKEREKEKQGENPATIAVADDAPTARIVSSLLKRAIRDKASDIHIEPLEDEVQVRFRLDGVLRKKLTLPKDIQPAIISRIKILSNLKIDEQRLPQDGRFSIHLDNRRVDFRVSTLPTAFGEKIVMRILDKATGILTIEQLGLQGSGLETLKANLDKSHGMVLVTGPTGSGKTTTLYALIDRLFAEGVNIVTLEDPIEYQMPGINQSQVNANIDYSFASGLRSIVRQDPDIIMIGEIRDSETAEMAIQSALTGHVVLSTLHTNNAAGAAPRLIDMGMEPFLLTSSINLVIGQRLARKICDKCKEKTSIPATELESVKKIISTMPEQEKNNWDKKELNFYKGKGCKDCEDTGYKGREGIFEVLGISENIRELVLKKVSSSQLEQAAIEEGMLTMIQDGIIKALEGKTSLEEVWRVTKD